MYIYYNINLILSIYIYCRWKRAFAIFCSSEQTEKQCDLQPFSTTAQLVCLRSSFTGTCLTGSQQVTCSLLLQIPPPG